MRGAAAAGAGPEFRYRRGDIWMVLADPSTPAVGNEIWSNRPAVIVSNNVLNARSGFAQVVYLSTATRKRSGPTHVELPAPEGTGTAMALCEQVHSVDASRLRRKMGVVPEDRIRDVDAALALSMSIGRNPNTHGLFRKWEEHVKLNGVDIAKEIDALAGQTTDQRVDALSRALLLVATELDSYRSLYEAQPARDAALADVQHALGLSAQS
jgi:mRNA interferase MazF